MGPHVAASARQAKSKARISAYEKMLAERSQRQNATELEIYIPPGPRLGDAGDRGRRISKELRRPAAVRGPDFSLPPGGIVGVIGPNGAGKTTLLR